MWGIVTDRDIVVRAIAEGQDPTKATLGDVAQEREPDSALAGISATPPSN